MSAMKELYDKVSKDPILIGKFQLIMTEASKEGIDVTEQLLAFAEEAGFKIQRAEMQEFFRTEMQKQSAGELSDEELDQVAGGKSVAGSQMIAYSVGTLGMGCAMISAMKHMGLEDMSGYCTDDFQ